jgi:hypothetical protein
MTRHAENSWRKITYVDGVDVNVFPLKNCIAVLKRE